MVTAKERLQSPGFAYALVAALLFGASTPASKWLLADLGPWLLAALLYLGAGIGLGFLFLLRRWNTSAASSEAALTRKDAPWLATATIFGGILAPVLLLQGLEAIQASMASLLLNFETVFTALIAWIIFKEHFDRRIVAGMACILAGGLVLSWSNHLQIDNLRGPLFVLAACACWALDNNMTRKIAASDPIQISMVKVLVAGFANLTLALSLGTFHGTAWSWIAAGWVGFFSYGISLVCFVLALRSIGTLRTGALFSIAPFVGAALSVALLSEPVSWNMGIAGLMMAVGVGLLLTELHTHEHTHEVLEHEHLHRHDEHHQHEHGPHDPPGEPHSHWHRHETLTHTHPHHPDMHHRHKH